MKKLKKKEMIMTLMTYHESMPLCPLCPPFHLCLYASMPHMLSLLLYHHPCLSSQLYFCCPAPPCSQSGTIAFSVACGCHAPNVFGTVNMGEIKCRRWPLHGRYCQHLLKMSPRGQMILMRRMSTTLVIVIYRTRNDYPGVRNECQCLAVIPRTRMSQEAEEMKEKRRRKAQNTI
jgi:hypothetical protein